MVRQEIVVQLKEIINEYLSNTGFDLVDLIYKYEGRDLFLRVFIDKPEGGITLQECARVNTEISMILDEKGIPEQKYILEVSSPGLDRPLTTRKDFLRCIKRKATFFLSEPVNGKLELSGLISGVTEDAVEIKTEQQIVMIPLSKIKKAKQIINN